jgi:hypothetical protein
VVDSKDTAQALGYVAQHIEPPSSAPSVDRSNLQNPDNSFAAKLLQEKAVAARYFSYSGSFTEINGNEYIDSLLALEKKRAIEEKDAGLLGRALGIEMSYKMRLMATGELPVALIDNLEVKGNNKSLSVKALAPEGYDLIWNPTGDIKASANDIDKKIIIINGDLTSPEGLLVALHEIGHTVDLNHKDPQQLKDLQRIQVALVTPGREELVEAGWPQEMIDSFMEVQGNREISPQDTQLFLQAERNAWAFALKTLAPLISDPSLLAKLRGYIHEVPLTIQTEVLRVRGLIQG